VTVTEVLMKTGSWSIRLKDSTPKAVRDKLDWQKTPSAGFGHVFVFPTRIRADLLTAADALSVALFTGVLREWSDERTIAGPSLAFWLGDEDDKGDILEAAVSQTSANLSTWVTALRPVSLNAGTVAATGSHTGKYQWISRRKALDAVCAAIGAEWRITPDAKLHADTAANLYASTPIPIATRRTASTRDAGLRSIPARQMRVGRDLRDYVTKVWALGKTSTASASGPATSYLDINGNAVKMIRTSQVPEAEDAANTATTVLNRFSAARRSVQISTDLYAVAGAVTVGGNIYVYDPDTNLWDSTNQIYHQGLLIQPVKLRVYSHTWPVQEGMGVAFRDGSGTWTDLSDWFVPEANDASVQCGYYAPDLLGEIPGTASGISESVVAAGEWNDFTPTLTQTGSVSFTATRARYRRMGTHVTVHVSLAITGAGTAGSALVLGGLPVAAANSEDLTGPFTYFDAGNTNYVGVTTPNSTTSVKFATHNNGNDLGILPNFATANGDVLRVTLVYEAAP